MKKEVALPLILSLVASASLLLLVMAFFLNY